MKTIWTDAMERKLIAAIQRGQSRRAFARARGLSESAVIAKYNRLNGVIFPYDAARGKLTREQAAERKKKNDALQAAAVAVMQKNLAAGMPRWAAIKIARKHGATLRTLGAYLGVSHQAVHQYVDYHSAG